MKKLILVLLIIALLAVTSGIAYAGVDWSDPCPPGADNGNGNKTGMRCLPVPDPAANNGQFILQCTCQ